MFITSFLLKKIKNNKFLLKYFNKINIYYVNPNSLFFIFNKIIKLIFLYFFIFLKFLINNVVFFFNEIVKIHKVIKYVLNFLNFFLLKIFNAAEIFCKEKKVIEFIKGLKGLITIVSDVLKKEELLLRKNILARFVPFMLTVIKLSYLVLVNLFNILWYKYVWKYTKKAFWAWVKWEIETREAGGSIEDFLYHINEIKNFIIYPYLVIKKLVLIIIGDFKLLYKFWKKKRPEKFYFYLLYYNTLWYYPFLFRRLFFKIKFTKIYFFLFKKFSIKKIPLYFFFVVMLLLILKYLKVLIVWKLFSSRTFNCLILPFKAYWLNLKFFFLSKQKYIFSSKFRIRRNWIFKWVNFRNRFKRKFKYKKNYFFKSNRRFKYRNPIYRYYLRRKFIDRKKVVFAEAIRKMCNIRRKRRLIILFYKIIPINILLYLWDKVYNYDILLDVVDTLRYIS